MKSRFTIITLAMAIAHIAVQPVGAQLIYEITPNIGWRAGGGFDFTPNLTTQTYRFGFTDATTYGVKAAVGFTESFFLEFEWDRQPTSLAREGTVIPDSAMSSLDVNIDYYHSFLRFQHAYDRLQPIFFFGLGMTRFYPANDLSNRTRFSFGLGGGIQYFLTHRLGLRGQVRFYTTAMGSSETGYWCDFYGCWSTATVNWMTQWSFSGGIFIRFGGPKRRRY